MKSRRGQANDGEGHATLEDRPGALDRREDQGLACAVRNAEADEVHIQGAKHCHEQADHRAQLLNPTAEPQDLGP